MVTYSCTLVILAVTQPTGPHGGFIMTGNKLYLCVSYGVVCLMERANGSAVLLAVQNNHSLR